MWLGTGFSCAVYSVQLISKGKWFHVCLKRFRGHYARRSKPYVKKNGWFTEN